MVPLVPLKENWKIDIFGTLSRILDCASRFPECPWPRMVVAGVGIMDKLKQ